MRTITYIHVKQAENYDNFDENEDTKLLSV